MTASLAGKTAIVTGGAQGIGRAIAEFFARDGASVMIADIQRDQADANAERLREEGHVVDTVEVDIADPAAARRMVGVTVERFGSIDILVNNAGIDAPARSAWEIDDAHWREIIDVDLSGAWWCTQAVLPHMLSRRAGRIIFISSVAARRGSKTTSVAYSAAKAGLIGLTIGMSTQVEEYGVLVNAITPGPTGTGRLASAEEEEEYRRELPLGLGGPEPVAHACLYLARDSGAWISGTVLNVSGGRVRG